MEVTTIGIDLAKNVFALSLADERGKVVMRKRLRRGQVLAVLRELKPCLVGMEACGGAHYWARVIGALGHRVKLMSPVQVRPYRQGPNKHDRNDADAICEAVGRPQTRSVAVKSVAQQDVLALHRVRAQLMKQRIALSNQLRGLLHERGVVAPLGAAGLRRTLVQALADESNEVSGALGELLLELSGWLGELEQRIAAIGSRIERAAQDDERCTRLQQVPGVGPQTASALVAVVGNAREFKSGRELSAYLGLVPRQHSSGDKTVMLGISKHGDRYLRTLLIHGARAVLNGRRLKAHPRAAWARRIMAVRGPNVAAVALANHNARVLWALLCRGHSYDRARAVFRPGPSAGAAPVGERARAEKLLSLSPATR
jgi:transposase